MRKFAVIGGGVAGLTVARALKDTADVVVFEKENSPGGLIRCKRVNGSLFHLCGGHVFNSKDKDVLNWFWSIFDREKDFINARRRSAVCLEDGSFVDYPIENHVYQLPRSVQESFYRDCDEMIKNPKTKYENFEDFLLCRFGRTLFDLYFKHYNDKVWRSDLKKIPLTWLEGKLPMPTPQEMIAANMNHIEEREFVHSSFYYEKNNGSQFLADTLARGLNVRYNANVFEISIDSGRPVVNGEAFDAAVFCGNVKHLPALFAGLPGDMVSEIEKLEYHGTTAVFCETDPVPYSWFYQPSRKHQSHRFICTGNFASSNNAAGKMTCTVEFTDYISRDEIVRQLKYMPFHPKYIDHHYSEFSYPIQHVSTRRTISALKEFLAKRSIYLSGRFAEWEYFNMDAAMGSALRLCAGLT